MTDDIIDLSGIIERRDERDAPAGTMALWGAEGERSRFALPLWRVVHLAGADRGIICWRQASGDQTPRPFIVLDVAHDPARVEVPTDLAVCEEDAAPAHAVGLDKHDAGDLREGDKVVIERGRAKLRER